MIMIFSNKQTFWVVLLTSFQFFFSFGLSCFFNPLQASLIQDFHLNPGALGFLSSLFFYAELSLVIPAGLLVDRVSPVRVTSCGIILLTISVAMMALASDWMTLVAARLLMGLGAGVQFAGCVRVLANWLKPQELGSGFSLLVAMGFLGGMLMQMPLASLIHWIGWREALWVLVVVGLMILAMVNLWVSDLPNSRVSSQASITVNVLSLKKRLGLVLKSRQNVLSGFYVGLLNLPVFMFGALWGIAYLETVDRLSNLQAATICSMIFLGFMIGGPIFGYVSDHIGKRVWLMRVWALLSLILVVILVQIHFTSYVVLLGLYLLLGMIISVQNLAYPLVVESSARHVASSATAVISIISLTTGGAIAQPLFGFLVAYFNHGQSGNAIGYERAIWIMPIAFLMALILSFGLREPDRQSMDEH